MILSDKAERISPAAYWELLMNLTRREVKGRYSQSFFGVAWAIAQPLATMAVFTIVFSRVAKMPSGGVPYPIFAYAALVPWFFFSNSVASGTLSLITYRNIVTKTYFPREIVPLAQVCSRFIDFFAAAALYAALMAYYRIPLGPWALMTLVFFALLVLFTVGFTFATSALNVFYRDVNPVVQIALQLWLYLTPVAYPIAAISPRFRPLFVLNPLSAIVEGFRSSLVFGRAPEWPLVGVSAAITIALFTAAFVTFKRMDKYFADVI
ncbi:MAG: phosphate ABC transporter permease [Acidobacteria bacterium]|nr:MAG: phosphate ABC transporter permease [Acidobacteriota bacterium]PYQ78675.1 MAG: phosphate ABC transporter permease [Acidobacteriota bacterium]PYQ90301.1 MAG: phosphate ABC transporter permease [Acidobacteriota bacterium]PYR04473.1 MAG: phosphate ABC transporter permease [Acidobacteriota bacterium]